MKFPALIVSLAFLSTSLLAADSSPKDEVVVAAKKLAEKPNYSWKTTVVVPESSQFKPGPTDGKTEKDGYTHVTMSFGNNMTEMVLKGDKAAVTNQDGDWQSTAELENAEGPGRFMGRMAKNFKAPAAQAIDLVGGIKELKKDGEAYAGEMSEEAAKSQFRFGNASGAKGSAKFWIKDGVLTKFEFHMKGKVDFNGNEMEVDRATTVEVKEVGTSKVNVPEAAKKKLT